MIYINHHLKAIYIRIPKTGGKYISEILQKYYGFKEYLFVKEDISDFFDKDEHLISSIENYSGNVYSIRKQGISRYYLDYELIDDEKPSVLNNIWNSYYKFTFVANPYVRFVNSYLNYISRTFKDERNRDYDNDCINKFIDNKDTIPNLAFFSTFINQYEHLLDYENNINFKYIGKTETLDADLITILNQLNVPKLKHLECKDYDTNSYYKFVYKIYNIFHELDDDVIFKINSIFEKDFQYFNYNCYSNSHMIMSVDFLNENNKKEISNSEKILNLKLNNIYNLEKKIVIEQLHNNLNNYIENIEKIYNITDTNSFNNQYKLLFEKMFLQLQGLETNNCDLINDLIEKNLINTITEIECNKCGLIFLNSNSFFLHNIFCKK
jgi:hypothetical protein